MPRALWQLARLKLVAVEVGVVNIDRAAHKTTYTVPKDPLRSHKVRAVEARFAKSVSPRRVVDQYGHWCQFVAGRDGNQVMRYWVLQEKNMLPLALYVVDFDISGHSGLVGGYSIRDVTAPEVRRRYEALYQHYMALFND